MIFFPLRNLERFLEILPNLILPTGQLKSVASLVWETTLLSQEDITKSIFTSLVSAPDCPEHFNRLSIGLSIQTSPGTQAVGLWLSQSWST